jgi:hypothetical protein
MKLKNINDVNAFTKVIDACTGDVWLESIYGDKYQLKSKLSQYVAIRALLKDEKESLELFAATQEDRMRLVAFISTLEK